MELVSRSYGGCCEAVSICLPILPELTALNIAEASALDGGNRRRHFRIARASAIETVAAYELAEAIGEKVPVAAVRELAAAIAAMLTSLAR